MIIREIQGKGGPASEKKKSGEGVGMTVSMTPNNFPRILSISPVPHRHSYLIMTHEVIKLPWLYCTQYIIPVVVGVVNHDATTRHMPPARQGW